MISFLQKKKIYNPHQLPLATESICVRAMAITRALPTRNATCHTTGGWQHVIMSNGLLPSDKTTT